jgi:hypothetical protein
MRVIRYDNMCVPSLLEARVATKSSKGAVKRPFQYVASRWLIWLRRMTLIQDSSGALACDVVAADAEGSRCPEEASTASSPGSVITGAGVRRGGRRDRGSRGACRA